MFHVPNPIFLPRMHSKVFVYLLTESQLSLDFPLVKGMQSYLGLPEDDKLGPPVLCLWAGLGTETLFWGTAECEMKDVGLGARPCVWLWAAGVAAVTEVCCSFSVQPFCPCHTWGTALESGTGPGNVPAVGLRSLVLPAGAGNCILFGESVVGMPSRIK